MPPKHPEHLAIKWVRLTVSLGLPVLKVPERYWLRRTDLQSKVRRFKTSVYPKTTGDISLLKVQVREQQSGHSSQNFKSSSRGTIIRPQPTIFHCWVPGLEGSWIDEHWRELPNCSGKIQIIIQDWPNKIWTFNMLSYPSAFYTII